jgi:hypothetical protein
VLAKEQQDRDAAVIARAAKKASKAFDRGCRWPEPHRCRFGLESAHIKDASLCGPMVPENLVTVCGWIHRRGPESIHGKQLKIEPETARGARGPLSFWRQGDDGKYHMIARESRPGQIERD